MSSYLKSAIDSLYSEDDDYIVLGLTGRTGSGCSTLASILTSEARDIKNSLYTGNNPSSNEERKQKIIHKCFEGTWKKFTLIQVRSIITLLISNHDIPQRILSKIEKYKLNDDAIETIKNNLKKIKERHNEFKNNDIKSSSKEQCNELIQFYSEELPSLCEEIKKHLGESNFVKLYQFAGKNLRISGEPFNIQKNDKKSFTIAETVNAIIKSIRDAKRVLNENTLIVIDAIRNPLEAFFFQERYSSFYLIAISTPEEQRKARLRKLGYTDKDIKRIDKKEYNTKELNEISAYSIQDIQACLQRADIYINNPDEESKVTEFKGLANQIIRFVILMKRPGIITPTPIERCMQLAYTAKLNSGCISRQVGAAITDSNYSIQAIGWNDAPYGQVPCNLRNRFDLENGHDTSAYSEFERTNEKYIKHFKGESIKFKEIENSSRNISFCFKSEYNSFTKIKNQVHTRSLHAEENAFLQLSKYGGRGIYSGFLFTTASPCELCSKKAYQLGIRKIFYIDPYPGIAISHILHGGSNNPELILFSGAIGRAFHSLYMPVTPYKDELSAYIQ